MRRRDSGFLRFLTSALMTATALVVFYVLVILADPQTVINPFPPPTVPAMAVLATPTDTISPPTMSTVPTLMSTDVSLAPDTHITPFATDSGAESTAESTATPEPQEPQASATVTIAVQLDPTATSFAPSYVLQAGSIGYTTQFSHPEEGCNWIGIAGTVFNTEGGPAIDLIVHVAGPSEFWMDAVTGSHEVYGEAGYEITLGDAPFDSEGDYTIQLLSAFGEPLSDQIAIDTLSGCDGNLILVNFAQTG